MRQKSHERVQEVQAGGTGPPGRGFSRISLFLRENSIVSRYCQPHWTCIFRMVGRENVFPAKVADVAECRHRAFLRPAWWRIQNSVVSLNELQSSEHRGRFIFLRNTDFDKGNYSNCFPFSLLVYVPLYFFSFPTYSFFFCKTALSAFDLNFYFLFFQCQR